MEEMADFFNKMDFYPVICHSPPAAIRTEFRYHDAMDRACEQVEKYLFPEFKAILQSIQNIRRKADTAEEVAREALILVAQALQEARRKRIQGRFGYSASKKMEGEVTGGQLTKRHQDILEETRLEQKHMQRTALDY